MKNGIKKATQFRMHPRTPAGLVAWVFLLSLGTPLAAALPAWPQNFTDAGGHVLRLDHPPRAIVSLTLASDEMLFDLVDRSRLAAITFLATDKGISSIAAAAQSFPRRLSGEKEPIIALQPDLVLVADWKEKEFIQSLRDAGISVFVMHSLDIFVELRTSLTLLGALCGETQKAAALVARIDLRLKAVGDRLAKRAKAKPLGVLSYSFFGTTYARGTSFDALVEAAGLVNVASRAGLKGWPQLSKEQVIALDPDIILLPSWSYEGKVNARDFMAGFVKDPIFSSLKAVRTARVISLPDAHLLSNSQYMVDAVEDLARAAYPELFR